MCEYLLGTTCITSRVLSKGKIRKERRKGGRRKKRRKKEEKEEGRKEGRAQLDSGPCLFPEVFCKAVNNACTWRVPWSTVQMKTRFSSSGTLIPGKEMTWWCAYVANDQNLPKPSFLGNHVNWNFILGGSGHSGSSQSLAFTLPPVTIVP